MYASTEFMQSPGFQLFVPFSDTATPGFYTLQILTGRAKAVPVMSGANGEATMQFTITSAAPVATPDAVPYSWGRVATIPAEVGGP